MNKPDDKVTQGIESIDTILSAPPVNLAELKASVVMLLAHLASAEGKSEANLRAVDLCFCLDETWPGLELPGDFEALFADIGGALHDTLSHPEIASNFESTPEQLLARAKKLNIEPTGAGHLRGTCEYPPSESPYTNATKKRLRRIALLLLPVIALLLAALFSVIYILDLRDVGQGLPEQYAMLGVPIFLGLFLFLGAIIAILGVSLTTGLLLCRRFQGNPLESAKLLFWLIAAPLEIYSFAYSVICLAVFVPMLFE
ncbi:MAG: hypothetical protein JW993_18385 [Sedimentisphaerales bacterium]|nr:hypothetical protein [Sedimentisphaerales bacterium]